MSSRVISATAAALILALSAAGTAQVQDAGRHARYLAKAIDEQLPRFFGHLPPLPYGVEPVPADLAPNYTSGRYVEAPLTGKRAGLYWVNTYGVKRRPLYSLRASR
jgi:uncharacterized protein (DUF885 family)